MSTITRKPNTADVNVGRRIRQRRRQLKLSQTRLGDSIGVSFQQIQKYEKGTNRISASALDRLAKVLGVEPGYFYSGWEHPVAGLSEKEQAQLLGDRADIVRLTTAFERIDDEATRRNLIELAEQLAAQAKSRQTR